MSIHYLRVNHPTAPRDAWCTGDDASGLSASKADTSNAVSNALTVTQRSPGWNNRKPDIQRIQVGACTLLAVPYRRWAWRRYELRVAEQRRKEA